MNRLWWEVWSSKECFAWMASLDPVDWWGVKWRWWLAWSTKRVLAWCLLDAGELQCVGIMPGVQLSTWSPDMQSPGSKWEMSIGCWLMMGWWCYLPWTHALQIGGSQVPMWRWQWPNLPSQWVVEYGWSLDDPSCSVCLKASVDLWISLK